MFNKIKNHFVFYFLNDMVFYCAVVVPVQYVVALIFGWTETFWGIFGWLWGHPAWMRFALLAAYVIVTAAALCFVEIWLTEASRAAFKALKRLAGKLNLGLGETVTVVIAAVAFSAVTPYGFALALGGQDTFWQAHQWVAARPVWIALPLFALYLAAGFALLTGCVLAVIAAAEFGTKAIVVVTRWAVSSSYVLLCALISWLARSAQEFLMILLAPALAGATRIGEEVARKYERAIAYLEEERALRRLYREEYADAFGSFREFRRAWEALQNGEDPFAEEDEPEPEPAPDPLEAALALMGLTRPFTKAELARRYRALMREVHPDAGGSDEQAAQVNAARNLIRERMGWT